MITTINCSAEMLIEILHATNNSLTSFGCIKDMNNIITLHLAYNKISQIPENMFVKLNKLKNLNLSFNLIKELTPSIFSGLLSLNLLQVDIMSYSEFIRAELPKLSQICLTTSTWDCEKLLAAAKIYNNQKVSICKNSFSTKANCQMENF